VNCHLKWQLYHPATECGCYRTKSVEFNYLHDYEYIRVRWCVLEFQLKADHKCQIGTYPVTFDGTDNLPLYTTRHTVASSTGSQSLLHQTFHSTLTITSQPLSFDGDGLPDAWGLHYRLNPNLYETIGDLDGDRLSGLDEYLQ